MQRFGTARSATRLQYSLFCLAALIMLASSATGCGDDDDCVTVPVSSCAPLYQPNFDNVFSITLQPSCGVEGSACHSAEGAQAGLVFDNADDSYAQLAGSGGRVLASDASCSLLMSRLASEDDALLMPPGQRLSDEELCAITQWIEAGAAR